MLVIDPNHSTDELAVGATPQDKVGGVSVPELLSKGTQFQGIAIEGLARLLQLQDQNVVIVRIALVNENVREYRRGAKLPIERLPTRQSESLRSIPVPVVLHINIEPIWHRLGDVAGQLMTQCPLRDVEFKQLWLGVDQSIDSLFDKS